MGANASITFPKSLAIQVFWLIGRILSKIVTIQDPRSQKHYQQALA